MKKLRDSSKWFDFWWKEKSYLSNYVLFTAAKKTPCNWNDDATKSPQPSQLKVFHLQDFIFWNHILKTIPFIGCSTNLELILSEYWMNGNDSCIVRFVSHQLNILPKKLEGETIKKRNNWNFHKLFDHGY